MRIIRLDAYLNLKIFECKNNNNDIYIKCKCPNCKAFANECNKILKEKQYYDCERIKR